MIPCDVLYQDEEVYISSFDKRLDESHVRTGPIFRFHMVDNAHDIFHAFNNYSVTLTRYISIFLTYWLRFCHASLFSTERPLPSVALSNVVRTSMADVQRIHNYFTSLEQLTYTIPELFIGIAGALRTLDSPVTFAARYSGKSAANNGT